MTTDEQVVALMAAIINGEKTKWDFPDEVALYAQDLFDAVRAERQRRFNTNPKE